MINDALFILVLASFGGKLWAEASDQNRYDREMEIFGTLEVYGLNGQLVRLTKERSLMNDLKGEITFELYTRQTSTEAQELKVGDATSLQNGGFDPSKPTYVITHGWQNNGNSPPCLLIRDAYLVNTDSNVIVVDWSSYSMSIYYVDVTCKVKEIGEKVQRFIEWLYDNGVKADDVTLVGHSLGAHVMGLAGYGLNPKVNNLVGLDPARPMFFYANASEGISREDANHVQIIHTNYGLMGSQNLRGHSNFFPNGGTIQPGCCGRKVKGCIACCHDRAYVLFAESISQSFVGTECDSYSHFLDGLCDDDDEDVTAKMGGLNLSSLTRGAYYLRTGQREPFSIRAGKSARNPPVGQSKSSDRIFRTLKHKNRNFTRDFSG